MKRPGVTREKGASVARGPAAGALPAGLAAMLAIAIGLAAARAPAAASLDGIGEPRRFAQRDGESLYQAVCQGCHMPDGRGAQEGAGHYPALAENPRVGAAPYVLRNVIHGRRGMPALGVALDDAQVAAVVNYVRTHFGNHFDDAVRADDARAERANPN
jgi:mono/diheme cytochrome c family protein